MASLSNEAKALIGVLLVGVAGYLGWNLWFQSGDSNTSNTPTTVSAPVAGTSPTGAPSPLAVASTTGTAIQVPVSPNTSANAPTGSDVPVSTEAANVQVASPESGVESAAGENPEVVSPDGNNASSETPGVDAPVVDVPAVTLPNATTPNLQVSRELTVATLPFLITSPLPDNAAASNGEDSGETTLNLPQADQRVSINPFAPILIQETPVATITAPPAPGPIENVVIPPPPTGISDVVVEAPIREVIRAPAPQPVAPPAPQVRSLPRALPSGTLPVTPSILRSVRRPVIQTNPDPIQDIDSGQQEANIPSNLASQLSLRIPESSPAFELSDSISASNRPAAASVHLPAPLRFASVREATAPSQEASDVNAPISAGINDLSRFVRDNDIRFTGSVLGPVGVGVFRSSLSSAPTVIALGQNIPDTDIVLTEIKGEQAVLTQNQQQETLILDTLRR